MTATVLSLHGDSHHAVLTLLPWYVSGRLEPAELAMVESHLASCPTCHGELEWERKMWAAQQTLGRQGVDAEPGLALLHRRIQASREIAPAAAQRRRRTHALQWLAAAQFALIAVLATVAFLPRTAPAPFHALGAGGAASAANLVVRFRPDASEQDIRQALHDAQARVVDGPTVTDAYLLSVPAGHESAALASLRARPVVTLANSLASASGP